MRPELGSARADVRVAARGDTAPYPGRHVRAWQREAAARNTPDRFLWWWKPFAASPQALAVVNGFVAPPERGLVYDSSEWQPAETYIRSDGLLLRAALRYEDRLASRPGGRER